MAADDYMPGNSLYVGDLHPEVTEKDLAETFGEIGPVLSVHICREKLTQKSLCYGYVNFWFSCHASAALKYLNHTTLMGKSMRIMWCQKNPITKKNTAGNVFVKNLDQSITSAQLDEIFSKYGTIISCKVAEENGISKGFGFVQFDSEYSAMESINALHDTMLEGKKLYVSRFLSKSERIHEEPRFRSLFVKNLDEHITEDLLKNIFSAHGNVSNVVIMKDKTGKSKGYGFVNFDSHEAAKNAMQALNRHVIGSKNVIVHRAQTKEERKNFYRYKCKYDLKASHLFVKNLDSSVDDIKLEKLFSWYGKVISAKVIRNGDGFSRGFGFVRFSCPDEAKIALNSLIGANFEGKSLYVALARSKEQLTNKLQKSYAEIPHQPFYTSNPQPLNYNFPQFSYPFPIKQPIPWQNSLPQILPTSFGPFVRPFQAQNFGGFFNAIPMRPLPALDGCRKDRHIHIWKGQNPSNKQQKKIIGGDDAKELCKGSDDGVTNAYYMRASSEIYKIRPAYGCHPVIQYLQPGFAANYQSWQY